MLLGACTFQIPSSWVEDKRGGSITDAPLTPNIALCVVSGMQLWQVLATESEGGSLGTMMPFSETLFIRETVEEDEIYHFTGSS